MNMHNDVCAGIVMYNPNLSRLILSLNSISRQVPLVVIVDNGSSNIKAVSNICSKYENIIILCNSENKGIAYALNQICIYAFEHHFSWVLTLDHDTVCSPSLIIELSKFKEERNVGILCPIVDYEGLNIQKRVSEGELTETYACMTSGSLTSVKAWHDVGGFREDYFIDFVDNEFCMNLHIHHYKILRVNSCVMHHQLGEAKEKRLLGIFKRKVCIHSPYRYYYMTRNNLLFIWEYKKHLNILKEYLKLCYILWCGLLYADEKKSTLQYICRGISDAFKNVTGIFNVNCNKR